MATLAATYKNLYDRVSHFLGLTAEGTTPTGAALTQCQGIVTRGLRQFLYPMDERYQIKHEWSFLKQQYTFSTAGDQWKYALPIDFSEMITGFTYDSDQGLASLLKRSGQQIKEMRSITDKTGWPEYFAIVPATYDLELGTSYELWLYPTPSQAYIFSGFYRIDPLKMSTATDPVIGGVAAAEAILESCLGVAETQEEDNTSTHHQQEARRLTQILIRFDSGKTNTEVIGNLYKKRMSEPEIASLLVQDINFDRDVYA